jgi:hypothetical protein
MILKEITNSVHLDVLVGLFLVLVVLSLSKYEERGTQFWLGFASAALGMAILSKLYPVVLVPAFLLFLFRIKIPFRQIVGCASIVLLTVVVGYLPLLSIETSRLLAGLSAYAAHWRMNEGFFALFRFFLPYPRIIAAAVISLFALLIPWVRRSRSASKVGEDFQWILLLWFLLIPTPYPWYATPLVALAVVRPLRPPSIATAVLSGVVGLYYLSFFYEYNDYAGIWWAWTRGIEHSIIWITLGLALALQRDSCRPARHESPRRGKRVSRK